MKYGLFGKFIAQPGKRDDLRNILLQASQLLERNKDCIHYLVSVTDDPDAVWVTELWNTKEAHDASLDPEDIKELIKSAMPLIASMPDQTELQVAGGKGF